LYKEVLTVNARRIFVSSTGLNSDPNQLNTNMIFQRALCHYLLFSDCLFSHSVRVVVAGKSIVVSCIVNLEIQFQTIADNICSISFCNIFTRHETRLFVILLGHATLARPMESHALEIFPARLQSNKQPKLLSISRQATHCTNLSVKPPVQPPTPVCLNHQEGTQRLHLSRQLVPHFAPPVP
jgi:hypothetical protein